MARERRNTPRKQTKQRRRPSAANARAAHARRADIRTKRRRRDADEGKVIARIGATPRRLAKGGRPRKDPANPVRAKRNAPAVARGKGGRPRSRRMRERIARRRAA